MNQDAYLPHTIVESHSEQQQQQQQFQQHQQHYEQKPGLEQQLLHPYKHQGAYAILRPHTTTAEQQQQQQPPRYEDSAGLITEDVRKSYVRQKLPVRHQSLAAAYTKGNNNSNPSSQPSRNSYRSMLPSDPASSSYAQHMNSQNLKVPARTSSIVNLSSLAPQSQRATLSPNLVPAAATNENHSIQEQGEIDEEEEFNFQSRPPSMIVCTQPIVTDATSSFSPDTPGPGACDLPSPTSTTTTTTITPNHPVPPINTRRPSDIGSVDTMTTVSTRIDGTDDASNWAYSPVSSSPHEHYAKSEVPLMAQSRSEPITTFTIDDKPRESCDTELSNELNSPIDNSSIKGSSSRTSIFLRMQQKREEQRKSIYAYRYSRIGSPQPHHQLHQPSMVYPAVLSLVARELYRRLPTTTLIKDDIEHHNVFRGKDAVERLLLILRTHDRNLALLVGRALDAQNFFHDVNYEHRLRDSAEELYQFRESLESTIGLSTAERSDTTHIHIENEGEDRDIPTGVFTVLTDCYSPTCTRERTCYSAHCPRKATKTLRRTQSQSSMQDEEIRNLWMHSVPKELVDATSREERKRQECIYELIYTEQDFVRDLQYVHNLWVKPLITGDIIPDERREHFVQEVFWNMADIEKVNSQLARALSERQKNHYWISSIGDILLEYACEFDPFVAYGAHQVVGKFYFELEKKRNPRFAAFVEETERKPQSRRLELNGYLTKPTTRLGRYNLLLREILKCTPEENPDRKLIPQIMDLITEFLVQVNTEAGNSENAFNLQQIETRLSFKVSENFVDLRLRDNGRRLIMKGRMKRKGNSSSDASDLQLFLFDHYLVFAKIKYHNHLEIYRVYRKPIPLELLTVSLPKDTPNNRAKRASSILPYSRSTTLVSSSASIQPKSSTSETINANKSGSYSITFHHHGRRGSPPLTLYAAGESSRKSWAEKIKEQQAALAQKRCVFALNPLVCREFTLNNKINSSTVLPGSTHHPRVVIGADQGVYISNLETTTTKYEVDQDSIVDGGPRTSRILHVEKVSQISFVDLSHLVVLADKTLWAFPYDMVAAGELQPKSVRPISQHAAFFYVGVCMGKTLVCVVKTSALTPTTIRVFEPVTSDEDKKGRRAFIKRLVRNGTENLKPYKDLYLPSEASGINLLRTKMCVSCPQEIGVIDMKSFEVQALLDPDDEELSFVFNRQDVRPISIYRIQFAEYLVCYNEFAFVVDQRGRLKRTSCRIDWESIPDAFALCYPYILAFEPEFIEVRNILTGTLDQRIRGTHIRCTNTGASAKDGIHVTMSDVENEGYQALYQLDLVKQHVDYLPQLPALGNNSNSAW
ncbi:CNH domain-containing protein [Zychaea mexicana]|uniref:CNH domain-containing protein n=1 Tax=Zychaea mexicana TaxID=64656 RepID=UPI0022FF008C|nr:CNH domain-containing protein [Zychaea mexicana]KAI9491084.1 CNH domain-containing protein [Zychaea mexicana]